MYSTSYPSFCLPSWKRFDLLISAPEYVNRTFEETRASFAVPTATLDLRRTSLKALLVAPAKAKKQAEEAFPVCKSFLQIKFRTANRPTSRRQ